MVTESWNIHGWIAVPLETIARAIIGLNEKEIRETFLSADAIEAGTFVEAMFFLLRHSNGFCESYEVFANETRSFWGKPLSINDKETIIFLFEKFKSLCKAARFEE